MDTEAQPTTKPQDSGQPIQGINLPNLIMAGLLELIKMVALIDTQLKFNSLNSQDFGEFYSHFQTLFRMSEELIVLDDDSTETNPVDEIRAYFARQYNLQTMQGQKEAACDGLALALLLKAELVDVGLWRIFNPPIQPPFLRDRL